MSVKSLVKSTLLLGSTSAATIIVGIVRVKLLALMVGPAGLGLLGTLSGLAGVGTTLFAMGADTSGTRRLAMGRHDADTVRRLRLLLLVIAAVHGTASVAAFWWLSRPLSRWVFGSEAYTFEVSLLGVAVALSLVAGLQIAVLQGLGKVRDIARIGLVSSLIGTLAGLLAVWQWGLGGLIVLIIAQPAAAAALLARATAPADAVGEKRPDTESRPAPPAPLVRDWQAILREGAPFMVSYVMLALVPLAVRALVTGELGLEAAGHFHAAWTMSVIYIGFLLNAMSADYFPRLTAMIDDRRSATALVNDQAQVGLAIGGPILLVMLAGAPLIVPALYSTAFAPAEAIVAWQALGNLMKIAAWPVAFLAMARGRSMQFLALELAWTSVYFALVWVGLPHLGLVVTGQAFAAACALFLVLQTIVAGVTFGFRWRREALIMLAAFTGAGIATLAAAHHSLLLQALVGGSLAVVLGLASLRFILSHGMGEGRMARTAGRLLAGLGWPVPVRATATEGKPA